MKHIRSKITVSVLGTMLFVFAALLATVNIFIPEYLTSEAQKAILLEDERKDPIPLSEAMDDEKEHFLKAVCEVCGKSYGKLDPNNHTDLKHFPAKAATEDSEGNIEYWYCSGCNKYYRGKDGTKEIAKADTVTAKLPKSPPTGDNSNLMLWIALLFISGGIVTGATVVGKKKKHSVK